MEKQRKLFLATGLGITGNVAGILVAVKRKSGFWGGVGWFIVGGLAGAALGYIAYSVIPDSTPAPTVAQAAADQQKMADAMKMGAALANKDLVNSSLGTNIIV